MTKKIMKNFPGCKVIMMSISLFSDMFSDSQLFIMFEFADCGRDLESYEVSTVAVNGLKFQTLFFLFSSKMLVIRAGFHKLLVNIGNGEDPDQTASSE